MKTVVVYESMFGNTEHVARTIAEALERAGSQVTVTDVARCSPSDLDGCDLLVLGAPTHALLPEPTVHARRCGPPGCGPGPRSAGAPRVAHHAGRRASGPAWTVPPSLSSTPASTRCGTSRARLPSETARSLRSQGFEVLDRPTSFYVEDVRGPLVDGERERARIWARHLLTIVRTRPQRQSA